MFYKYLADGIFVNCGPVELVTGSAANAVHSSVKNALYSSCSHDSSKVSYCMPRSDPRKCRVASGSTECNKI